MTTPQTQLALLAPQRTDLLKLDPREIIVESGFNVRQDFGDMEALIQSIASNGVLTPLRGFKKGDKYVLTDGHRRHRAAMHLITEGVEMRIPFIASKEKGEETRLLQMYLSNDGKRLNAIETSELMKRFINLGLKPKEISQKLGISVVTISNLLLIADLPVKLKKRIENNEISSTLVLQELRGKKIEAEQLADQIENILESPSKDLPDYPKANSGKDKKVTAKDLNAVNSTKVVKDFLYIMEKNKNQPQINSKTFDFLNSMFHNELEEKDVIEFFLKSK